MIALILNQDQRYFYALGVKDLGALTRDISFFCMILEWPKFLDFNYLTNIINLYICANMRVI
jgi:hypothetical protein